MKLALYAGAAVVLVLLLGSLFYLVLLGKWDAASYAAIALSLITGIGGALATAFTPPAAPAREAAAPVTTKPEPTPAAPAAS